MPIFSFSTKSSSMIANAFSADFTGLSSEYNFCSLPAGIFSLNHVIYNATATHSFEEGFFLRHTPKAFSNDSKRSSVIHFIYPGVSVLLCLERNTSACCAIVKVPHKSVSRMYSFSVPSVKRGIRPKILSFKPFGIPLE